MNNKGSGAWRKTASHTSSIPCSKTLKRTDFHTSFHGNHTGNGKPRPVHSLYSYVQSLLIKIWMHPTGRFCSFVVHRRNDFVEHIMPIYFRMSKFSSFQRQLNLYNFNRITTGRDRQGMHCFGVVDETVMWSHADLSSQGTTTNSSYEADQTCARLCSDNMWKEQEFASLPYQKRTLIFT
jgi:hypothetical protein